MDIGIPEILAACGGRAVNAFEPAAIEHVSTDTRTLEPNALFFPLKGPHFDGHDFLKEAFDKGARVFVVSDEKKIPESLKKSALFICVDDTLKAYGDLAKTYRQKFKIPVITVTGSSGKTTLKEMLAHLLSAKFKTHRNRGTENNLIGVPKTIFQLSDEHEVLVLEIGTNFPGEIERLASIASPQIGVVTQIGLSHLEGLKDLEGVKKEKLSMLKQIERGGMLAVNGEDPNLKNAQSGMHKIFRAGFSAGNEWVAEQVWFHEKGSSFQWNGEIFETQLLGKHNVLNALLAVGTASLLGVDTPSLKKALASFKPVAGRLYSKEIDGIVFLDDSYNSNPTSFKAALDTLKEIKTRERKAVVCGDMLELGAHSETLHREAGKQISEMLFDYVIAVGPQCQFLVDEAVKNGFNSAKIHHAADSAKAGELCRSLAKSGDRILVKGSRGMKMEKIFECFTTSSTR